MEIGDVSAETFAGREGQSFTIQFADGTLELELAAVTRPPGHWARTDRREPFSVLFHGSAEHVLPQRIWPLDHDELGRLELFLVPVESKPDESLIVYEAVFN